ncbi:hypothetical protein SISSUDRAFT_1051709 [Sistotremastrum suecicum HHB10207 ss-3]|uniref:SH3 domain-containing protein n=1 Tax=Sistotremastrum suecicum HHB10207 ss-3 TaxID=1314776 RepID=A0A166AE61_9AGAM|nr:hypothetical protein SISSUDRAFT_1051709 [Sistotremastrum suecicum HHB10207 ss-3]
MGAHEFAALLPLMPSTQAGDANTNGCAPSDPAIKKPAQSSLSSTNSTDSTRRQSTPIIGDASSSLLSNGYKEPSMRVVSSPPLGSDASLPAQPTTPRQTPDTPTTPTAHGHGSSNPPSSYSHSHSSSQSQAPPGTVRSRDSQSSLHSNRPAPPSPSPAGSRRTSTAASTSLRHSNISTSSNISNTSATSAASAASAKSHQSNLSNASNKSNAAPSTSASASTQKDSRPSSPHSQTLNDSSHSRSSSRPTSAIFKIRDFAYSTSDTRHLGRGPDAPWRRGEDSPSETGVGGAKVKRADGSYGSYGGGSSSGGGGGGGWSGFRWSGLGSRFSWAFSTPTPGSGSGSSPSSSRRDSTSAIGSSSGNGGGFPSKSDFERNFDQSGMMDHDDSVSGTSSPEAGSSREGSRPQSTYQKSSLSTSELDHDVDFESSDADVDADDYDRYSSSNSGEGAYSTEGDEDDSSTGLVPGLYRALYQFTPEGTAEMGLEEGQIVRIVGRGGGVGWAIAVRDLNAGKEGGDEGEGEGMHALVPEGYLELVRADDEDD